MKKLYFLLVFVFSFAEKGLSQQNSSKGISSLINTKEFREHAFSISGDDKTFVFAQDRPSGTQLFVSTRTSKNAAWSAPKAINNINEKIYAGKVVNSTSLSFDGSQLYFSAELPMGSGETDIYFANRLADGLYSEPINIGEPLNTALFEGYPSISADGKRLFFVRDSFNKYKNVENCYTIWTVTKGNDGSWSNFEKLSETVNSDCEKAPFIMPDGRTLIFSSIRGGGKGGFDLYQTELQDDGSWTFPKELDFMNTPANDEYVAISGESDGIYFENNGDIFLTSLPKQFRGTKNMSVEINVIDALTKQPIDAAISVSLKSRKFTTVDVQNGVSILSLRMGKNYNIVGSATDFVSSQTKVNLEGLEGNEKISNTLELMPLKGKYSFKIHGTGGAVATEARIKVIDMKSNQLIAFDKQNTIGLTFGNEYLVSVSATNYVLFSTVFEANSKDIAEKFNQKINLIPSTSSLESNTIEEEAQIEIREPDASKSSESYHLKSDPNITFDTKKIYYLNDISFDKNSAQIKSEFYVDINRLIELMTLNPKISVQVSEVANASSDTKYNQIMIERQTKACLDYLVRGGIEARRVLLRAFNENDLASNATSEEDKNQKLQFMIY